MRISLRSEAVHRGNGSLVWNPPWPSRCATDLVSIVFAFAR